MAIPALNGQFGKTRFIVAAEVVILLLLLVLFSDGDVPPRVDADLDEEGVVLDVLALLEQFVRHELGEAEAELVDLPARPLEVGPVGVGDEALDDVARPPPVLALRLSSAWSSSEKLTVCLNGHFRMESYSPGRILM